MRGGSMSAKAIREPAPAEVVHVLDQTDGGDQDLSPVVAKALRFAWEQGSSLAKATREAMATTPIDAEDQARFLYLGVLGAVTQQAKNVRGTDAATSHLGRYQLWSPAGNGARDILGRVVLAGADGRQKPLFAFDREDCTAFHAVAVLQVKAWDTRRQLMSTAADRLRRTQKSTIGDLPATDLAQIRRLATEAWG